MELVDREGGQHDGQVRGRVATWWTGQTASRAIRGLGLVLCTFPQPILISNKKNSFFVVELAMHTVDESTCSESMCLHTNWHFSIENMYTTTYCFCPFRSHPRFIWLNLNTLNTWMRTGVLETLAARLFLQNRRGNEIESMTGVGGS